MVLSVVSDEPAVCDEGCDTPKSVARSRDKLMHGASCVLRYANEDGSAAPDFIKEFA